MEKILIVGCKKIMDNVCIGCSRCMVSFNKKNGEFKRYENSDAEIIGLLNCGDCPSAAIITRLAQIKLWNQPMGENVTKIHIGPCILGNCPYKDTIIQKLKAKAGVEVIEGTHPYKIEDIFA